MKAVEEETSIRQEMDSIIETVHAPHADSHRYKRMEFCERMEREGRLAREKRKKTAKGRTQEPLKETARVRTQAPLKVEATRWKGGEKSERKRSGRRERKRKKRKSTDKEVVEEVQEFITSLSLMRVKEGHAASDNFATDLCHPRRSGLCS